MFRGVAAGAALLSVAAASLPAPLAATALAITFLVTPGTLVARIVWRDRSPEARRAAALALSPFLSGVLIVALLALGMPLSTAARGVAIAIGALALVPLGPRATAAASPRGASASPTRAFGAATLAAAAAATLVLLLFRLNPWLAGHADGWFHAAVALQIAQRGIPPEDPYFAGLRLLYFWGPHAWAAAWLALAPRLQVWTPLIAFNVAATAAVALAMAAMARRLGAGPRGATLAIFLMAAGYTPFGWLLVIARAMVGEVRGWAELMRTLGAGADPVLGTMAYGQLHSSMAFFGDKYLVLTQFSLGLALFLLCMVALLELLERPGARAAVTLALLVGAALFLHTLVGDLVVALGALVWGWRALAAARGAGNGRRVLPWLGVALVAPALALLPYLIEVSSGKRGQFAPGLSSGSILSAVIGGALFVIPGFRWLLVRARAARDARVLAWLALVLLILGLTVRLADANQSKFFNFLFLLLAAPATFQWMAWLARLTPGPRTALAAALLLATVPTAALGVWAYASERNQEGHGLAPPGPTVREAMAWVRNRAAKDAAFCDLGGARDLLAIGGRSVLWGGPSGERDWGYPPEALAARRALVGALCRGREPGGAGAALLAGLHREVIVVTRAGAADSLSDGGRIAAQPRRYERLWQNDAMTFWRLER